MSTETEKNRHAVTAAIDALSRGDIETYANSFAPDLKWTIIGSTKISGTYQSRDELFSTMSSVLNSALENSIAPTIVDTIAEGDRVVLQLITESKAKNGVPYKQRYCWIMTLKQGLIVDGMVYLDTALVDAVTAES